MCPIGWDAWTDNSDWNLKRCFSVRMRFRHETDIMGCTSSMSRKNSEATSFRLILVGLDGAGIYKSYLFISFKDSWIVMAIYRLYWSVIDESSVQDKCLEQNQIYEMSLYSINCLLLQINCLLIWRRSDC